MRQHKLHPGHIYVTDQDTRIWVSFEAGTVVCIKEQGKDRGGGTFILPEQGGSSCGDESGVHGAERAVMTLIATLLEAGARLENLEAGIFTTSTCCRGALGGNVQSPSSETLVADGDSILSRVISVLSSYGIKPVFIKGCSCRSLIVSYFTGRGTMEVEDTSGTSDSISTMEIGCSKLVWAD